MKKFISAITVIAMLIAGLPAIAADYTVTDGFAGANVESWSQKANYASRITGTVENGTWKVTADGSSSNSGVLGSALTLPNEISLSEKPFSISFKLKELTDSPVKLAALGFSDGRQLKYVGNSCTGILYSQQYFYIKGTTLNGKAREKDKQYSIKLDFLKNTDMPQISVDGEVIASPSTDEFGLTTATDYTSLKYMILSVPQNTATSFEISEFKVTKPELGIAASAKGNNVLVKFDSEITDPTVLDGLFSSDPLCDISVNYDAVANTATLSGFDYAKTYKIFASADKLANINKTSGTKRYTAFEASVTTESYSPDTVITENFEAYQTGTKGENTDVFSVAYATDKTTSHGMSSEVVEAVDGGKELCVSANSQSVGQNAIVLKLPQEIDYTEGKVKISATMRVDENAVSKNIINLFGVTNAVDVDSAGNVNTASNTKLGYGDMGAYVTVKEDYLRLIGNNNSYRSGAMLGETAFRSGTPLTVEYTIDGSALSARYKTTGDFEDLKSYDGSRTYTGTVQNSQTKANYLVFTVQTVNTSKGEMKYYLDDITVSQEKAAELESADDKAYGACAVKIKSSLLLEPNDVNNANVTVKDENENPVSADIALDTDGQTILITPKTMWETGITYTVTVSGVKVLNTQDRVFNVEHSFTAEDIVQSFFASASDNTVKITAELLPQTLDGSIIIAVYDSNNRVIGTKVIKTYTNALNEEISVSGGSTENAAAAMFIWNFADKMKPLAEKTECDVK